MLLVRGILNSTVVEGAILSFYPYSQERPWYAEPPTLHEIQTWSKRTFLSFLPHCPHLCPASREHLIRRLLQCMKAGEAGWP